MSNTSNTKKRTGYRMFRKLTEDRLSNLSAIKRRIQEGSVLSNEGMLSNIMFCPVAYGLSKQGAERLSAYYDKYNTATTMAWFEALLAKEMVRQGVN